MQMKYYVYQHIRLDKDIPFYIGIGTKEFTCNTHRSIYSRAYSKYRKNPYWQRIINLTNYKIEIIFESDNYKEVKNKEIELIALYGRVNNGGILCNITEGGDGSDCNRKGVIVLSKNSEFLYKFSSIKEASYFLNMKEETIINNCKNKRKNQKYIFVYDTEYDSSIDYTYKNNIGVPRNIENYIQSSKTAIHYTRQVHMYSLDNKYIRTFNSIRDANNFIGTTNHSSIARANKLRVPYKGYLWKYGDIVIRENKI